jgi:hypothetical protein
MDAMRATMIGVSVSSVVLSGMWILLRFVFVVYKKRIKFCLL